MVKVRETDGYSSVHIVVEGDFESVRKAVQAYLQDYPEAGYGTRVLEESQTIDGEYYCKLWRLASCD
jgi:hypothetical protein